MVNILNSSICIAQHHFHNWASTLADALSSYNRCSLNVRRVVRHSDVTVIGFLID